jgi:hypothetical protein
MVLLVIILSASEYIKFVYSRSVSQRRAANHLLFTFSVPRSFCPLQSTLVFPSFKPTRGSGLNSLSRLAVIITIGNSKSWKACWAFLSVEIS